MFNHGWLSRLSPSIAPGPAHLGHGAHVAQPRPLLRECCERALHLGNDVIHIQGAGQGAPAGEVERRDAVAGGRGRRRRLLPVDLNLQGHGSRGQGRRDSILDSSCTHAPPSTVTVILSHPSAAAATPPPVTLAPSHPSVAVDLSPRFTVAHIPRLSSGIHSTFVTLNLFYSSGGDGAEVCWARPPVTHPRPTSQHLRPRPLLSLSPTPPLSSCGHALSCHSHPPRGSCGHAPATDRLALAFLDLGPTAAPWQGRLRA